MGSERESLEKDVWGFDDNDNPWLTECALGDGLNKFSFEGRTEKGNGSKRMGDAWEEIYRKRTVLKYTSNKARTSVR